ncbi:MAG: GntR family transcriptional regulator [Granulosicoccus sp.]|nr:GntR family transcriptional regulator [Granulosicoccus sp.]
MLPIKISGDERIPVYQRLADSLREAVVQGDLKPGDRAPSENVLSDELGVATGTVRNAFDVLVSERVFERFQGRGTFVCRPSFDKSLFRFFRLRNLDNTVAIPQSRILRREVEPLPGYVAAALEVDVGTKGISMSRLRLHDDQPVLAEEIMLVHEQFETFAQLATEDIGDLLYPVYEQHCNQRVARADEKLTVEVADASTARLLRMPKGSPVIVIERIARGYDNSPIEWRRSRGRADLFTYHTEIR